MEDKLKKNLAEVLNKDEDKFSLDTKFKEDENVAKGFTKEQYEKFISGYPFGIGDPIDIVSFAEFLISEKAKWITGESFMLSGGSL